MRQEAKWRFHFGPFRQNKNYEYWPASKAGRAGGKDSSWAKRGSIAIRSAADDSVYCLAMGLVMEVTPAVPS